MCVLFENSPGWCYFLSPHTWHTAVPTAPARLPALLPRLWSRYFLVRAQGLSTHPNMGSCARKASLPPVSRASPLLPEQAGPVGRWAGEPGSSWLHPSHLDLLSSMFLVCASSCPSSAHLGQAPKQVAGDRAPGGMCLPTGDLFGWGEHQWGEAAR